MVPQAAERQQLVDDIVDAANPQAVPAVIGPAPSGNGDISERTEVVDAADGAFVSGIRLAELAGFVLTAGALVLGWRVFPRTVGTEHREELAEAVTTDDEGPAPPPVTDRVAIRRLILVS